MYEYPFEKLKIWQSGKSLAVEIYSAALSFPAKDKSGMSENLKNAVLNLTTSLSEGNWKTSAENARTSIDRAHLSLMELLSLIIVSKDLKLLNEEYYQVLRDKVNELSIMLLAFKKSLNARAKEKESDLNSAA